MKAFLVTSSGTFSAIIAADRASRKFEADRDPARQYLEQATAEREALRQSESVLQRAKEWGRENRYSIVTASWVASMGVAFGLVSRDKYLTGAQKLVQARVYAQGLTIAILLATALLEVGDASKGKGRWETVKIVDPNDPEHKHLIEKRIHHEAYEGEDLWRGMFCIFHNRCGLRLDKNLI
jgi:cytochrome c-type biogenesis protein CcmH/NrfG